MRVTAVVLVVLLFLFAGCKKGGNPVVPENPDQQHYVEWPGLASTPWPMFMHDPQHTGRSMHKGPQTGAVQWQFDASESIYSSPVIDENGTIYVGSDDHYLYAISPDGSLKWKYLTADEIVASPLIAADGTIYAAHGSGTGAANGALLALDRSGNLKWKYELVGIPSQCAPTISKDGKTVYISSGDMVGHPRKLYAINSDGSLRWTFGGKEGQDRLDIYSPAFSPDGTTMYMPGYYKLFAVDTSGVQVWEFFTGSDVSSSCVDIAGNIYVSGNKQCCIAPDGTEVWSRSVPNTNEPPMPSIGWDGTVYICSGEAGPPSGQYIHAFRPDGSLKWMQCVGALSQGHPVSDVEGTVYVGACGHFAGWHGAVLDSSSLYAINSDGTYKFRLVLRSADGSVPDISSTPAIGLGNKIYVGSDRPRGISLFAIY
jgi:outer membrane protein assembly factor BamB